MMQDTITLEPFGPDDLGPALALSQGEGWPHRAEDWALILGLSRGIVARVGGRVVATALATRFGPVAMANMIIVAPEMRGRGLGRRMMERLLTLETPGEWRLVATEDGRPLYEKLGFVATGRIVQHQGILAAEPPATGPRPSAAAPADLPGMAALDRQATGADRAALLAALLHQGPVMTLGQEGFAAARPFGRGTLLGPVVATDDTAARALLGALMAGRQGQFLRIDIAQDSGLSPWLAELGLQPVGGGTAMRRGLAAPASPNATVRCLALAAQALG